MAEAFWSLFGFGALGGLVRAIIDDLGTENCITLPFWRRSVALGFVGDALVGGSTALVAYTFFNVLNSSSGASVPSLQLIGFGIAAGYAGTRILNAAENIVLARKVDDAARKAELASMKAEAIRLYDSKKYSAAAKAFEKILAIDPTDTTAKLNLALALSYLDTQGEERALKLLQEVVAAEPNDAEGWYDIACIRAVATFKSFSDTEVFEPLKKAVDLDASLKQYASKDQDFDRFRTNANTAQSPYAQITGDTATSPLK